MAIISLANGRGNVIVDDEDVQWLSQWKWFYTNGYASKRPWVNGKQIAVYMHRLLTDAPRGKEVDHINGNKLDNRKSNLRIATRSQNSMNSKSRDGSSSKYKLVSWCVEDAAWRFVYSNINYADEKDAALAADKWMRENYGEFARLNFPQTSDYSSIRKMPYRVPRPKGLFDKPNEDALVLRDVQRILGVSHQRVHQLLKSGLITGNLQGKICYYDRASVMEYKLEREYNSFHQREKDRVDRARPTLDHFTTSELSIDLGIPSSRIRKAISDNRIDAQMVGKYYFVDIAEARDYFAEDIYHKRY